MPSFDIVSEVNSMEIENAVNHGATHYPFWSKHNRIARRLDSDPRFQKLLERIKREWEAFR